MNDHRKTGAPFRFVPTDVASEVLVAHGDPMVRATLGNVIAHRDHLARQVTELQARGTELVRATRAAKCIPAVGVLVRRGRHLLFGLRKGGAGAGLWSTPGGLVATGESFEAASARELYEETGIVKLPGDIRYVASTPVLYPWGNYLVWWGCARVATKSEPSLCEPDKCERWEWFGRGELPAPRLASIDALLKVVDPWAL